MPIYSEMVPYADLILPGHHLSRALGLHLDARPADLRGRLAADAIRQPVVEPDRDVRPFQDVLIDLGVRLGLPGIRPMKTARPNIPAAMPTTSSITSATPGVGPLTGWRGEDGERFGKGDVNPDQLERYIENGCFHAHELPENQRFFKHANKDYLEWAKSVAFNGSTDPIVFELYSETLQRFRLAARGHGDIQPPDSHRAAHRDDFSTRCPSGIRRSKARSSKVNKYPLPCDHPAADAHVSFLGLAERLAPPDHG